MKTPSFPHRALKLRLLMPALLLALPLAACGSRDGASHSGTAEASSTEATALGRTVREATDKARREMANSNLKISTDGQPLAEITREGHLLIDGKDIPTTPAQRSQLLAYREQVHGIALAGMDVGVAGANLGAQAAGEAVKGIFSGKTDEIESRINAEADKLKAEADKICQRMPALLATQRELAASLPAFVPYATMDQSDIDDCGK